jgi:hypothetical protein
MYPHWDREFSTRRKACQHTQIVALLAPCGLKIRGPNDELGEWDRAAPAAQLG